jgi:hypothetical protein
MQVSSGAKLNLNSIGLALALLAMSGGVDARGRLRASDEQAQCPIGAYPGTLCAAPTAVSLSQFKSVVARLKFDGGVGEHQRKLRCAQDANTCTQPTSFPSQSATININPVDESHKVGIDGVTANGTIVARLVVVDARRWARFNLTRTSGSASPWYMVLVEDGQVNSASVVFMRVDPSGNRLELARPDRAPKLVKCMDGVTGDWSEARFSKCEVSANDLRGTARESRDVREFLRTQHVFAPRNPDDGIWMRCVDGCCATTF